MQKQDKMLTYLCSANWYCVMLKDRSLGEKVLLELWR